jgi:hypothetical protein
MLVLRSDLGERAGFLDSDLLGAWNVGSGAFPPPAHSTRFLSPIALLKMVEASTIKGLVHGLRARPSPELIVQLESRSDVAEHTGAELSHEFIVPAGSTLGDLLSEIKSSGT